MNSLSVNYYSCWGRKIDFCGWVAKKWIFIPKNLEKVVAKAFAALAAIGTAIAVRQLLNVTFPASSRYLAFSQMAIGTLFIAYIANKIFGLSMKISNVSNECRLQREETRLIEAIGGRDKFEGAFWFNSRDISCVGSRPRLLPNDLDSGVTFGTTKGRPIAIFRIDDKNTQLYYRKNRKTPEKWKRIQYTVDRNDKVKYSSSDLSYETMLVYIRAMPRLVALCQQLGN